MKELKNLQALSFALVETALYLDGHPNDKKAIGYYDKIKNEYKTALEKYEMQLAESEEKAADLKLQLADPTLASDYQKLMELQEALDKEEQQQESLLERMLETEMELETFQS